MFFDETSATPVVFLMIGGEGPINNKWVRNGASLGYDNLVPTLDCLNTKNLINLINLRYFLNENQRLTSNFKCYLYKIKK